MASKPKHPPGPAITLGNMRQLGVQRLIASCLNPSCRHEGLIDVSKYRADIEMPWFAKMVVCAKCPDGESISSGIAPNVSARLRLPMRARLFLRRLSALRYRLRGRIESRS